MIQKKIIEIKMYRKSCWIVDIASSYVFELQGMLINGKQTNKKKTNTDELGDDLSRTLSTPRHEI